MRGPALCLLAALVVVIAFTPAHAESVVQFTDGRYLKVSSYEISGGWIRLDVIRGSVMLFPLSRVLRIDQEGQAVYKADAKLVVVVMDPKAVAAKQERRLWKQMSRRSRMAAKREQPILTALH
jgi:hypothetical protein